ncbi:MAG: TetR/AcrR family transcriptional regulator [Sporichthyaceae bacterium]|nr:TetR/AcrR family transcriptional regulator [Sporichthyaceae bacterium]
MTAAGSATRRERIRDATAREIKDAARTMLVTDGIEALTLRAIAREIDLTAPALYRYFDSREALILAMVADFYDELTEHIRAAGDAAPTDDIAAQMLAACRALREWALDHRQEFGLVFANPVANLTHVPEGPVHEAGWRFGAVFLELVVRLWNQQGFPVPDLATVDPSLRVELGRCATEMDSVLPPEAVLVYLEAWTRLYGAVTMEVFGHLHFALDDSSAMFERQLADLAELFGLRAAYQQP